MGRPRKVLKHRSVKAGKSIAHKKENLLTKNTLCGSANLHEMETQLVDQDDSETDDFTADEASLSPPLNVEMRRTRSSTNRNQQEPIKRRSINKVIDMDDDSDSENDDSESSDYSCSSPPSPAISRRTRSSTNRSKTGRKIRATRNQMSTKTRSSKPTVGVKKNTPSRGKLKDSSKAGNDDTLNHANSGKSKKSSEHLHKKSKHEHNDSDSEVPKNLTDFMANLNVSPTSLREKNNTNLFASALEDDKTTEAILAESGGKFPTEKNLTKSTSEVPTEQKLNNPSSESFMESKSAISGTKSPVKPELMKFGNECSTGPDTTKSASECPVQGDISLQTEGTSGKLRSSIADAEGMILARGYKKSLATTEEFALNFISQECHHPVITCFRELTKRDISFILRNSKLKKHCNSLEQSIVYLGLIDFLATVNNNPVYGETETSKLSKNVSTVVQKVLLEFKNIIGTWALSTNEQLSGRYTLILNYLRTLVPMFRKAGFDEGLSNILDCIEKEVNRHKHNQEKMKAMSNTSRDVENSTDVKVSIDSNDGENRSALNEIILNVDLSVKLDDSEEEEDVTELKEEKSLQIFGKPLKGSSRTADLIKKKRKKLQTTPDSRNSDSFKPQTSHHRNSDKTLPTVNTVNRTLVPQPKVLAKIFSTSSPNPSVPKIENSTVRSPATKRIATENIDVNDITKKRKIEGGCKQVVTKEESIKSLFQKVASSAATAPSSTHLKSEKPAVNAFALMMNKSREIALKKKTDKANAVPTLKVEAVKS